VVEAVGVVALAVVASVSLVAWSWRSGAGETADFPIGAFLGWLCGSVVSLLGFAWFRSADASRRLNPLYVEPGWRPGRVVTVLALMGLLAGSLGAILVARAVARA
jgi:hypothetical protein